MVLNVSSLKVGGPLPPTASDAHGMIQITLATAADAGQYVCSASNSAGYRQTSANVYVQGNDLQNYNPTAKL